MPTSDGPGREELASQVRFLESEVADLRRRLQDVPGHARGIELRLADTQRSLAAVTSRAISRPPRAGAVPRCVMSTAPESNRLASAARSRITNASSSSVSSWRKSAG